MLFRSKTKEHSKNISISLLGKRKTKEAIENSVNAKKKYFDDLKRKVEENKQQYRDLYLSSGLTRKEFYSQHKELSVSTLKRYLVGL